MKVTKVECDNHINEVGWSNQLFNFSNNKNSNLPKVSVNIMVKDAERCIQRCIDSIVEIADEIIIVDTGSIDNTIEIINSYDLQTIKLYEIKWSNDFSKVRNYMMSLSSYEWIFQIDADEYLVEDAYLLKNLISLCDTNQQNYFHYISPKIQNTFDNFTYILTRRIFKNYKVNKYYGFVHEELRIKSHLNTNIIDILVDLRLLHDGYDNQLVNQKEKSDRNTNLLTKMLVVEPNNPRWYYFLARDTYSNRFHDKKSFSIFKIENLLKQAINLKPTIQSEDFIEASYVLLGQIYLDTEKYVKLRELIGQIKESYPNNVDSYYFELLLKHEENINNSYRFIKNLLDDMEKNDAVNSKIDENLTHILLSLSSIFFSIDNIDKTATFLKELDINHQKKFLDICEEKLHSLRTKINQ